ncbi:MAG: class I SAM-dependent methyltransferase [Bacteroidota bacterium]
MTKPIFSVYRKAVWYISHPTHWKHFVFVVGRRLKWALFGRQDRKEEALAWCQKFLKDDNVIIEQVTGEASRPFPEELKRMIADKEKELEQYQIRLGDGANLELLYQLIALTDTKRVIETGVAYGWSSLIMLHALQSREGHLISTDKPMPDESYNKLVGSVVPDNLQKFWTLFKEADVEGLPKALKQFERFDLCHYDSDKSYEGRMWAYKALWSQLREGGVFMSDDIGDNLAFKHFSEGMGREPLVSHSITSAGDRYVGVLVK